jgi:hypothetical protein
MGRGVAEPRFLSTEKRIVSIVLGAFCFINAMLAAGLIYLVISRELTGWDWARIVAGCLFWIGQYATLRVMIPRG